MVRGRRRGGSKKRRRSGTRRRRRTSPATRVSASPTSRASPNAAEARRRIADEDPRSRPPSRLPGTRLPRGAARVSRSRRAAPPRRPRRAVRQQAARCAPASLTVHDPGIVTTQAVRVVVWRDGNGVHVAPAGTVVSAITVDAVLVALDSNADLTAWPDAKGPLTSFRPRSGHRLPRRKSAPSSKVQRSLW